MENSLLFVYNADSGVFNTLTDIAHKIFSPQSYSCNLCAITYGNFAIRTEWKEFLESLEIGLEFLHRDEFIEKYGLPEQALPAVFLKKGEDLELWITADEINRCGSVDDLKRLVSGRLTTA
jgi:hypothetical protein